MTLFDAIESGDLRALRQLMRQGVDFQQIDEESGVAPLALAAECGHLAIVHILLRAGAHPDRGGATTPLEAAVLEGHVDIARLLIEAYADINRPVADGFTPLITAAATGNVEMVRTLIDAGALATVIDDEGESALSVAKKKGHKEVAAFLAAEIKNSNNGHDKAGDNLFGAIEARDALRLRALLDGGEQDLKARNRKGLTPLGRAAQTGHLALVQALLESGAEVDDGGVLTPLLSAAEKHHEPVIRTLLEAGADVNKADEQKRTPLMASAADGNLEIVRALLDGGADPKLLDHGEKDALWHAAASCQEQTFRLLATDVAASDRQVAETELRKSVRERAETATSAARLTDLMHAGELDHAKRLLASGLMDPDGFDEEGRTALMVAAGLGRRDLIRMLIAAGASFELRDDKKGWTALIHALHSEGPNPHLTVNLLVTANADLDRPSTDGATPLMHAVDVYLAGEEEEIEAFSRLANPLLHLGADVDAVDGQGLTAWGRVRERAFDEDTPAAARRQLARLRRALEKAGAQGTDALRFEILSAISEGQLGRLQDLLADDDEDVLQELPALSVAAANNAWDVVSHLLELGFDINTPNQHGETILMQAAKTGFEPIALQLLQVGGDASLRSTAGETAASLATAAGHKDLAKLLKSA
jgi:ankyrin repeat protein